ncbi:MAG: tyrosine-type recombinase/integrase [Chloroflexota bacterium]|nr:tyrosine-type recombinase/integrase [Chloroflexota bacterium]
MKALTPETVHGYIRVLKAFCTWLVIEDALADSPFRRVKTPFVPKHQPTPLTDEELKELLQACKVARVTGSRNSGKVDSGRVPYSAQATLWSARDAAIILTLVSTALRVSELLSMKRDTITPAGSVTVLGKGRKVRSVQMHPSARKAVWKYQALRTDPHEELWVGIRGPLTADGVADILSARSATAGIRHVNPHLLRHTAAVRFLRNKGPMEALMEILGHTSLEMTRRYVKLADTDVAESHRDHNPLKGLKW